jgi:hypothetical protein
MLANITLLFASKVNSSLQKYFKIPHLMEIRNYHVHLHFLEMWKYLPKEEDKINYIEPQGIF